MVAKNNHKTSDFQIQDIKEIIQLEKRDRINMTTADKVASAITEFSGSMWYVLLHVVWFAIWMSWNTGIFGLPLFDPFPFSLLTMIVSLEAIFLSSFVLISQNKQALQADKRAKIDLQVNMIAERETTKLIEMIAEIQQHLHIRRAHDAEVKELTQTTDINKLADEIDEAEEEMEGKQLKGPRSAVDTDR